MKRILNSTLFSWILLGITTVCITLSGILYKQPILYMLPLYISLVWLHLLSIIPKQRNVRLISNVREITAAILQPYLPAQNVQRLPALLGTRESKSFESEREILYSVLFDMRQEVAELRKMVHNMMAERAGQVAQMGQVGQVVATPVVTTANQPSVPAIIHPMQQATVCPKDDDDDIQDTEEYVEENLALDEVEKEMIRKALEKHHGKRKGAARDLKISERTLYRKIKEYELD